MIYTAIASFMCQHLIAHSNLLNGLLALTGANHRPCQETTLNIMHLGAFIRNDQ